jgi:hypothetical protein
MNKNYHQGIYEPINKEKYKGSKVPFARSGPEFVLMRFFDKNENVIAWNSEGLKIPYLSPLDKKTHNYFPDFIIQMKNKEGIIKTQIIEYKPSRETKPPRISKKRNMKTVLYESNLYAKNQAKWNAAKIFCEARGWEFVIITEKDLG